MNNNDEEEQFWEGVQQILTYVIGTLMFIWLVFA
jgi:hypothetical protein